MKHPVTLNKVIFPYGDLMRTSHGVQAVRNTKAIPILRKSWLGRLLTQKGNPL